MKISPLADPRDLPDLPRLLRDEPRDTEWRLHRGHERHLGHPYGQSFDPGVPPGLAQLLINNLGAPCADQQTGTEAREMERQVIGWLMQLWGCEMPQDHWGAISASGTEANLWGLHLGREALPDGVLLYSADAHASIPKAARMLRIPAQELHCTPEGEIDLAHLAEALAGLGGKPVLLALTCGTTAKGAHDDIAGAIAVLETAGYGPERRFVHVDAALSGMVLPFLSDAALSIRPGFHLAIDSLSVSGHKMIGAPMPCGALVCRRVHARRNGHRVTDPRPAEVAPMRTRNDHAVLAIWTRLFGRGYAAFAEDARRCARRAQALARQLRGAGAQVLCNPHSLTVVFAQPDEGMARTYQLACSKGLARAVVMPSVTEPLLDCFVSDYAAWATRRGMENDAAMTQPR